MMKTGLCAVGTEAALHCRGLSYRRTKKDERLTVDMPFIFFDTRR